MTISPSLGSSSPAIMRIVVVLPQPEGPRKTTNSSSAMSRSTSRTPQSSPQRFWMPFSSIRAMRVFSEVVATLPSAAAASP